MKLGIHIPQIGRKAGPEAVRRGACQAEDLGYDNIWVNDHLAIPHDACLLYTSPSPRDGLLSRMPSSA